MKSIRLIWFSCFVLFLLFALQSCYEEILEDPTLEDSTSLLFINNKPVFEDSNRGLMLYPVKTFDYFKGTIINNDKRKLYVNNKLVNDNFEYNFGEIDKDISFEIKLVAENSETETYNLFFTLLPLIKIEYNYQEIPDEPKLPAKIKIVSTGIDVWSECSGIEIRGGSSASKPKKSYGIEIWDDMTSIKNKNVSFLGMYEDDDWILDALYSDSSRVRNRVSFDLWIDMQKDATNKGYDTKYSGIKGEYIELFLNSEYYGLYCFNERVEAKLLNIKTDQTGQQGYLYKSENGSDATTFTGLPNISIDNNGHWCGWEQEYPKPDDRYDWKPLYNFIDFVVNSPNQQFNEELSSRLSIEQSIDYFILINIIFGCDNAGKNIFLSTESSKSPFYISPWDLDATWGRNWRGKKEVFSSIITFALYQKIISNNPENFRKQLNSRYFE